MAILRHSGNEACPHCPHARRRATPCHPVCLILDGDELAFVLSPGSVKGKSLARDRRIAVCVSDEWQPYGFVTIEGHARTSAEPDQVEHIAAGIADRY
jgi:hypothetical protein